MINHFFVHDLARTFFSSRSKYAIRRTTGTLGEIASFERRLRGADLAPIALPCPFHISTCTRADAERHNREVSFIFYIWAVYAREILGSWHM